MQNVETPCVDAAALKSQVSAFAGQGTRSVGVPQRVFVCQAPLTVTQVFSIIILVVKRNQASTCDDVSRRS